MKFEEIIRDVKQGIFAPIYLLHGEEPFFIDKISEIIQEKALQPAERAFNELVLYGQDTNVVNLVHSAQRFPMGASRQLIILREAQMLDKIDLMENYVKHPSPSTILVINDKYKTLDGRTKVAAAFKKQAKAIVFESKPLNETQVTQWISSYLKDNNLAIEGKAGEMLKEAIGTNLEKLHQAVEKLQVSLNPGEKMITADMVARNVGISKEHNTFELQKALINKNGSKAHGITMAFAANPKKYPVPLVTGTLFTYFSKLLAYNSLKDKSKENVASSLGINPYFVGDYQTGARNYTQDKIIEIVSLLREYDMKSKGFGNVNTSNGDLLKELVYKIMH